MADAGCLESAAEATMDRASTKMTKGDGKQDAEECGVFCRRMRFRSQALDFELRGRMI